MGKKFDDFVNKMDESAKKSKNGFDPMARIERFQKLVKALYDEIDGWIRESLDAGKIQTGDVPVSITEELLGSYSIQEKWIQIGNAKIIFRPIGTILIGTDARIDMIYRSKTVMIVRTGENVDGPGNLISIRVNGEPVKKNKPVGKSVWKYVSANYRLSYVTLNKENFENLIMDVINGAS